MIQSVPRNKHTPSRL